jgi:diacylglycerol kinase family enzyme
MGIKEILELCRVRSHGGGVASFAETAEVVRIGEVPPGTGARLPQDTADHDDDSRWGSRTSLLAVFANAKYFAGGWKIAPEASVSDGLFDIQVFEATKRDIPRLWWLAKSGAHVTEPSIRHFVAPTFTLDVEATWPVEADGEYFGEGSMRGSLAESALFIKTSDGQR